MPTYVLSDLERTIAGQKVVKLENVASPTTQLTESTVKITDRVPIFDKSDMNSAKYIDYGDLANPQNALTTLANEDRVLLRDNSDSDKLVYINIQNLLTFLQARIVASVLSVSKPEDQTYVDNVAIARLTLPAATGGTTPYTYAVAGLPGGLTFSTGNRRVTGTPTATGTFTVSYTVSDSGTVQQSITQRFVIKVREATSLALAQPTDQNYVPNVVISTLTLPQATGGLPPYSYVVTGLPDGLSFALSNRQVTGTPTEEGTHSVDYIAIDAENNRAIQTFSISVKPAGKRYVGALTQSEIDALNANSFSANTMRQHAIDETDLVLPASGVWSDDSRKIVVAQPASQPDLTSISLAGFGNSISEFTKRNTNITVSTIAYEIWIGNTEQGNVLASQIIEVRP